MKLALAWGSAVKVGALSVCGWVGRAESVWCVCVRGGGHHARVVVMVVGRLDWWKWQVEARREGWGRQAFWVPRQDCHFERATKRTLYTDLTLCCGVCVCVVLCRAVCR